MTGLIPELPWQIESLVSEKEEPLRTASIYASDKWSERVREEEARCKKTRGNVKCQCDVRYKVRNSKCECGLNVKAMTPCRRLPPDFCPLRLLQNSSTPQLSALIFQLRLLLSVSARQCPSGSSGSALAGPPFMADYPSIKLTSEDENNPQGWSRRCQVENLHH